MAREAKYGLLQADTDIESVAGGLAAHDGGAVMTRGGATKYVKLLAMFVLLVGAVGIYSVASSTSEIAPAQPSDNGYDEAGDNRFYEVAQDDSTPAPDTTVSGQLLMQVSNPAQFANDPSALNAVKESIAKIAGVPVTAVTDVTMVADSNGQVRADFKIDVPADTADSVAAAISSSTPEADSKILSDEIAAAGLSATYPETTVVTATAEVPTPNPCVTTAGPNPGPNPCVTTPGPVTIPPPVTTAMPVNPCDTTPGSVTTPGPVNPCGTTVAPANPCDTTQAPGMLARIFR